MLQVNKFISEGQYISNVIISQNGNLSISRSPTLKLDYKTHKLNNSINFHIKSSKQYKEIIYTPS